VIALGCGKCNNGIGLITLYETSTLAYIGEVQGREPTLQVDSNLEATTRLWYISATNTTQAAQIYEQSGKQVLEPNFATIGQTLPLALFNLNLWQSQIFYTDADLKVTMAPACIAGETPSSEGICQPCEPGFYSLGVQSACKECGVSAELLAYSTRESSIIDQVCTESNVVVETATDTLRSVAEALGLDMTYLLILAIAIPVMVLIPLAFMCMTGIFMLVLLPIICMLVRCFKKKARRPIKVKSIEQETEATLE
jgi:hypothetical protein